MTILIISQARMTSTRLPGKVLKSIAGRSLLSWHITRAMAAKNADKFILAITTNSTDDPLLRVAAECGVEPFRGSEPDVLNRYYEAASPLNPKHVVRITSDCPLIDAKVIDACIEQHLDQGADYTSNLSERTFPRGLDVEVFTFQALKAAQQYATTIHEREHVTPYIRNRPDLFKQAHLRHSTPQVKAGNQVLKLADMRWTVDTPEDFEFMQQLMQPFATQPLSHWQDILKCLTQNPHWLALNANVSQKTE